MTSVPFSDFKLIELVRQNKQLYDRSCADYRDLLKKDITWKAIAAALGTSAEVCRKRFRCLRDRFNKEKKFRKKGMLVSPSLPLIFKKMMFLWDHLSHRNYYSSRRHSGGDEQASGSSVEVQGWLDAETQNVFDLQFRKLSEMERRESSDVQSQIQIVEDHVRVEMADESPPNRKGNEKVRLLQPKVESDQPTTKKQKTDQEPGEEGEDLRYKPMIVTLELNGNGDSDVPNAGTVVNEEPTISEDRNSHSVLPTTTSTRSSSQQNREMTSVPEAAVERRCEIGPETLTSQLSCNEAFCLMLKDYLDHVTQPLKLSLLRIKILTILHNEVYGK